MEEEPPKGAQGRCASAGEAVEPRPSGLEDEGGSPQRAGACPAPLPAGVGRAGGAIRCAVAPPRGGRATAHAPARAAERGAAAVVAVVRSPWGSPGQVHCRFARPTPPVAFKPRASLQSPAASMWRWGGACWRTRATRGPTCRRAPAGPRPFLCRARRRGVARPRCSRLPPRRERQRRRLPGAAGGPGMHRGLTAARPPRAAAPAPPSPCRSTAPAASPASCCVPAACARRC
jgi:hypothetical protein